MLILMLAMAMMMVFRCGWFSRALTFCSPALFQPIFQLLCVLFSLPALPVHTSNSTVKRQMQA